MPETDAAASGHGLGEQLERWAIEAGFDRAGIATLEPSAHGAHLRRWLDDGHQAGMEWLARRTEVRTDPAQLLPGARSALCVALHYHPLEGEPEPDGDLWPRVARYARGRDYHDLMIARLKDLEARVREAFGCGTRRYVDTGPILERELAARAGIGVFGKNANLLHKTWGSYFLLGELLLTLDLTPSEPLADACGRCTRCLDACPTGALFEPYSLDSRRCISYWTIEHRGDLPEPARHMVGEWVFGCDVCQEVCPHNHRVPTADHPELRLPPQRADLDLAGLLGLSREAYVERFRKSPMKRAKLEGLQRNAAVAMGNRGDRRALPALVEALRETSPVVRRHAAWAVGEIAGEDAAAILAEAAVAEADPSVLEAIEAATKRALRPAFSGAQSG